MVKTYKIKLTKIEQITHDIKSFKTTKPKNFSFIPGQAIELSINLQEYKNLKRPFTIVSLNNSPALEFIIKIYKERNGVTNKLDELNEGAELLITKPFGTIQYKGIGTFIAGGAGITPFIAILRQLRADKNLKGNTLIFSNKTEKDIILKDELDKMAEEGLNLIHTLTEEPNPKDKNQYKNYENLIINESFLKSKIKNLSQYFYICGPIRFIGEIVHYLQKLGADADKIVVET